MAKDIQIKYKNEQKEWEELYPKTKTRNIIDDKGESQEEINENLTTQLAQTVKMKIVTSYGVVGDGVTDNTENLQTLLDEGGTIYFPNGTYFLKTVDITKDNTKLYFAEDVVLKSDHMINDNHFGVINILGVEQENFTGISDLNEGDTLVPVSSGFAGQFVDGGYIYLTQQNPTNFTVENIEDRYHRDSVKVIGVENNQLILNKPLSHSYSIGQGYSIRKYEPIKNVELIGNKTVIDNMGIETGGAFINTQHTDGLIVDGFHLTNGSGRAVYVSRGINFKVRNIKQTNPLKTDPGYGYGITVENGSNQGFIEYFEMYDSRHGVDICSGSNHILIKNGSIHRTDISGHGQNSKHITVENVNVYDSTVGVGIGVLQYGKDMNWTINNVHGEGVTRLIGVYSHSSDITITNVSTDGLSNTLLFVNYGYNITLDGGHAIDSFTPINLSNAATNVVIRNLFAVDRTRGQYQSRYGISIGTNCKYIVIDNVHIQGVYYSMLHFTSDSTGPFKVSSSTFLHEREGTHAINMDNAKDLTLLGNKIIGTIFASTGLGPYYLINNDIEGTVDIREATEGMFIGNYGDIAYLRTPDSPKFITKDNITND